MGAAKFEAADKFEAVVKFEAERRAEAARRRPAERPVDRKGFRMVADRSTTAVAPCPVQYRQCHRA